MASFTVSLTPRTVTVGQTSQIQVGESAVDAAGETLAPGFVNSNLAAPAFSVTVSDPTNTSTASTYSGLGSGPITYTVTTPGYPAATASLQFSPAAAFTIGYALVAQIGLANGCNVSIFPPQGTSPARTFSFTTVQYCQSPPLFDRNGVLWNVIPVGINPDGTSAGPLAPAGAIPLAFDVSGNLYTSNAGSNAVNVYVAGALVRQIALPAAPVGVTVDPSGNVYVGLQQLGLYEYGPSGTGSITPIAMNSSASGSPGSDAVGDVFAAYNNSGAGVWPAGTFSSNPPGRVITSNDTTIGNSGKLVVDPAGGAYFLSCCGSMPEVLDDAPPGSATFAPLKPAFTFSIVQNQIATPLR